jgi:hypothetical protein
MSATCDLQPAPIYKDRLGPDAAHVGSIFGKLGVRDRAAAIVFTYDHGVVTPGTTPL